MSVANAPERPAAPRGGLLALHPLVFYFLIAFSWLMFLSGLLTYFGGLGLDPLVVGYLAVAGLLGPVLSGFVVEAARDGGRVGSEGACQLIPVRLTSGEVSCREFVRGASIDAPGGYTRKSS
jgi:hypothetical protein